MQPDTNSPSSDAISRRQWLARIGAVLALSRVTIPANAGAPTRQRAAVLAVPELDGDFWAGGV